jgi:UDP-N-acetyl-D-mannosaminouronate:lipid I N-acetyl-D-mannosaminouronosyltransferase
MISKLLNGIKCYAPKSRDELISYAFKKKCLLVAVNAEKILLANSLTRVIINNNIGYPDGFGAILAFKKKGIKNVIKIPGCELWLSIIRKFYKSKNFYLIGGTNETVLRTKLKLESEYPGINIIGYQDGFFPESDEFKIINNLKRTKPDIVFVAMGSPKQEIFMERLSRHHQALYQGLGGSFDVYIGAVKRAPKLWVKFNLESLYRLFQEPKRINRQINVIKFLVYLYTGKLK